MKKDYCPGYFDLANGGVMGADETDEENAKRELEEEIGIKDVDLQVLDRVMYEDSNNRVWGNIFGICCNIHPEDMKLQADEVDYIVMMSMDEILKKIEEGEKFTPDGILAFKRFLELDLWTTFEKGWKEKRGL
jgi:8-oxo-dGTP pyrophosphatase MutT (NUDIX family)